MSSATKLTSNINRLWSRLSEHGSHTRGVPYPRSILMTPAVARMVGRRHTWGERIVVDDLSHPWCIRLMDGSTVTPHGRVLPSSKTAIQKAD